MGLLAWRSLAERKGRAALTLTGLVLGVALFTASLVTISTGRNVVEQVARDLMGSADVMVGAVGGGDGVLGSFALATFPATIAEEIAGREGVAAASPILRFPSAIETPDGKQTAVQLNAPPPVVIAGVDFPTAADVLGLVVDGELPHGPDDLVLPEGMARELAVSIGDHVIVDTPTGPRQVTVVGLAPPVGIGRFGELAFTNLTAAEAWAARPDAVSLVAVRLDAGIDRTAWAAATREAHGSALVVQDFDDLLSFLRGFVTTITAALISMGAAVIFLGGFLLYLTMSMAVAERVRLYGLLASLGARRGQVRRIVVGESVVLGVVAAVIGAPLGIALSVVIRAASARLLVQTGAGGAAISIPWWAIVAGGATGVLATVIAALAPARHAASVDAVEAMRTGTMEEGQPSRRPTIVGAAFLGVGAVALAMSGSSTLALAPGLLLVLAGAVLCTPALLRPTAALLGRVARRLAPATSDVAVLHLTTHRTRSAYTLALVMLVMALTIATGATHRSFVSGLDRQIDREFGDDLRVEAATSLSTAFIERLRSVDGVDEVATVGFGNGHVVAPDGSDKVIQVTTIQPDEYFLVGSFAWIDGDDASVRDRMNAGTAAVVPAGLADTLGIGVGDTIALRTAEGVVDFTVAATAEVTNIPPTIEITHADGARYFGIREPQAAQVNVTPGHAVEDVRTTIERELKGLGTFIVATSSDLKADARAQVGGGINAIFVLLALAGIVGVLGLANTMAMSVVQRTREIGILRAVGAKARDIRGMVAAEALTLVGCAFVLSLPIGIGLSGPLLEAIRTGLGDTTVKYAFPWSVFPIVAVAGLAAALVASLLPSRRAVALDVDATLRFD